MVRLGIISDSHGGMVRLEQFARLAEREKLDAIIHLGDGLSDAKWLRKNVSMPVHFVAGNCDWPGSAPREARLSFGGVQMLAVHGDKYGVKLDYGPLSYYAEEAGAAIALFGHTHQPFAGYVGGVMLLNPGALNAGKYAILEIEKGNAVPFLKEL